MADADALYRIADELRGIARLGLRFAENDYDRERYRHALALSARIVGALEGRDASDILAQFQDNLLHVSPAAGAEAVVVRDGALLLMRRADNGLWAVPGGLAEIGEPLASTAQRELWEEVGVRGRATRLLGIFDSLRWPSKSKVHLYHVLFEVETDGGPPKPGTEALEVGFFREDNLPPLSPGHDLRVPFLFRLLRGEVPAPYFDAADEA